MPIVIILLLALLVGLFGFWNTLQAILGAVALVVLVMVIAGAIALLVGMRMFRHRGEP